MISKESPELSIRNCIFGFQCQKSWQEMKVIRPSFREDGGGGEVRFCPGCEKEVYECLNDDELIEHVNLNRCIVIEREEDGILMGDVKMPDYEHYDFKL
tara:strand:+ start:100 stop:396 length:297 start_codon:yes stop_codon:yes gene_type:complete